MKIKTLHSNFYLIIGTSLLMLFFLFSIKSLRKGKNKLVIIPEIEQKTPLKSIQITIKEKHFKKIVKKRNKALADGILETDDKDYVPAIITFNQENYKAKIRLKGDWTDHLQGIKWSYRIKLKDDKTILGMRKFSIHHPRTRGYINEWLYHKVNKAKGLMGLRYDFVEGFLHIKLKNSNRYINKELGIYAIEETFDKRTIESNKRKEGLFVRISEKYFWKEAKQAWKIGNQTGYKPNNKRQPKFIGPNNEYISTFSTGKILKNTELHKQFVVAKNLLEDYRNRKLKASDVFDIKKLAYHTVLNNLFGAYHGLAVINLRFYYNPTTSLLEPIAYDGNSGRQITKFRHYEYSNVQDDIRYTKELIHALEEISQPDYLENMFQFYDSKIKDFENILQTEFYKSALIKRENYVHNDSILKQELIRLKKIMHENCK